MSPVDAFLCGVASVFYIGAFVTVVMWAAYDLGDDE